MTPHGYNIRVASTADVDCLPAIERTAGLLFKSYPADLGISEEVYDDPHSVETFAEAQSAGRLWVAAAGSGDIAGFALVIELSGYAHLEEIDVLPLHGRRGIGSALLAAVWDWAEDAGYPALTLRTFLTVPWNGPFYEARGFEVVDSGSLSARHLGLEAEERETGLRTDLRVTMARKVRR